MKLHPRYQRALLKILAYGILWSIGGVLFSIIERGVMGDQTEYPSIRGTYSFWTSLKSTFAVALIFGMLVGVLETFVFEKLFRKKSFRGKLLTKAFLYISIIITMVWAVSLTLNAAIQEKTIFSIEVLRGSLEFMSNFASWSIIIYAGVIIVLFQFFFEVSNSLGPNVLINFFFGKYYKPVEEQRIFMFLDLKDSTMIAEKLGHIRYFEMLKEYYAEISESVLNNWGEIYQYVGDEMVVSWKMRDGIRDGNCIACFFEAKDRVESKKEYFLGKYGHLPVFKAGLHCGKVSIGEIGTLKKEILFSGDVLNTTSRIQNLCNELKSEILISDALHSYFKNQKSNDYYFTSKGEHLLKGKVDGQLVHEVVHH